MGQILMEKEIQLTREFYWYVFFLNLEVCGVVYP